MSFASYPRTGTANTINGLPSTPGGGLTMSTPSPYRNGLAPIVNRTGASTVASGPSQFEQSHEVQLKKHRVQYTSLAESLEIDFKASQSKAAALIPQLQKRITLESEEIAHNGEEQVMKQLARVAQLRQDYQLAMKEMQRKHIEGQQRRIAGGHVNLDPGSPDLSNALAATVSRYASVPSTPAHRGGGDGDHEGGGVRGGGGPGDVFASAPFPPPLTNLAMPSSPAGMREFSHEFSRLESTHDKFLGRMGRNHDRCIDLRSEEVAAWESCKDACLANLQAHHDAYCAHLDIKLKELHAFFASQRAKLSSKQSDLLAREDRLKRSLEDMVHSAVHKLQSVLAEYLAREVPGNEQALQELNAAHVKHQRTLWAELQAQLEVHDGALREMLPAHNAGVLDLQAACFQGLAEHDKVLAQVLTDYLAGLHTLQSQYDNAESAHRTNLATIRTEHLRQLQSIKEGYLGEVAGLLEEYRARLAELKQQFLLRHEADLLEV